MRSSITLIITSMLLLLALTAPIQISLEKDIFREKDVGSHLTLVYPSYHKDQIILDGNESMSIGNQIVGNITLRGNSSVRILGTTLVNGMIKLLENSTLVVRNARLDVKPPPIGVNDIVVQVRDTALFRIQKQSLVTIHPQPIMKEDKALRNNASFIEVDDEGEILVEDSEFNGYLPGDVIFEATKVTAGTILITGYGKFTSHRSKINCYLNYTIITEFGDPYVEMERWFWISSQRYGTIRIENSTCILHEPGQTIFKPTNGLIILKNSTIHGNVRPETISKFLIEDCEIHNVNDQIGEATIKEAVEFNDHAIGVVRRTTIHGEVKAGWSSTNIFLGTSDTNIVMEDCQFFSEKIFLFANTSMTMIGCKIMEKQPHMEEDPLVEMSEASKLILIDTDIPDLHISNMSYALMEIHENITLSLENSIIGVIHHANIDRPIKSNITIGKNSKIEDLDLWILGSSGSNLLNLTLAEGGSISMKNCEKWNLNIILRNSERPDLPEEAKGVIKERYIKTGLVTVNDVPLDGADVRLTGEGMDMSVKTDPDGTFEFVYDPSVEIIGVNTTKTNGSLLLQTSFLGLDDSNELDTWTDSYEIISFHDIEAPQFIGSLRFQPEIFDQKKYIHVKCNVFDGDSKVVSEVILQYRVNGGTWKNMTMFHTEGDSFEAVLPRFNIGNNLEMRAIAKDPFNNTATTSTVENRIGQEVIIGGIVIGIVLSILVVVLVSANLLPRSARARYLKNNFSGERDPLGDRLKAHRRSDQMKIRSGGASK